MPLTPPKLDDLTASTAFAMMRARISQYAPTWTNHNESDPGITLLRLFADLADQCCYRLNRVPEKTHIELLKLLGVKVWLDFHEVRNGRVDIHQSALEGDVQDVLVYLMFKRFHFSLPLSN